MTSSLMTTYPRLPVVFRRGAGAWLWDVDDKRYLDAMSGVAVCNLGHAHPKIQEAICRQAGNLLHTSNWYRIENQEQLADALIQRSGMQNVFFGNSGAEANEAALKIARLYGHTKGINCPRVVAMRNSFHGRTMATLSATGNPKVQSGFEPLVEGFVHVDYGDLGQVAALDDPEIVGVLVEPVQGEGGVNIPPPDYLPGLRELCDRRGWLLMLDEIQTGMGRTGRWFAFQHTEIKPDVLTLAKALGNGVPIGACLANGPAAQVMGIGKHGSTFGGNPLACAAALAVIEIMENEGLVERAERMGARLLEGLRDGLAGSPLVAEVRGLGLMIGIELTRPCGTLMADALTRGVLINVTAERVVRLLPPLILDDSQTQLLIDEVKSLLDHFSASST